MDSQSVNLSPSAKPEASFPKRSPGLSLCNVNFFLIACLTCLMSAFGFGADTPDAASTTESSVKIVFFRPSSPPAAVKGVLELDGVKVGDVGVRRFALLHVAPGKHTIRFVFPGWAGTKAQSVTFESEPNTTHYLSFRSWMNLSPSQPAVATGIVLFSITPEMQFVPKETAMPFLAKFDLAFAHGGTTRSAATK